MTRNTNHLTKSILEESILWGWPEFSNLRHSVEVASNNPSKIPKGSSAPTNVHKDSNKTFLSFNFWKKIEFR